ncbi:MAG: S8 family serine peptidase, partial [Nannocystaceae bacterium]
LAFTPTAVAEGTSVASAAEVEAEAEAATSNVWVYFRDRGNLSAEQLREALSRRSAQIHPRALARRQRVRKDAGLDIRDLAPAPSYVEAVKATGATLRQSSRWLNAVSVQATTSQARALSKLPMVARVEPVRRAQQRKPVEGTGRMQWPRNDAGFSAEQLEIIGADYLQDCGLTGAGVVIGVQDSGFDVSHISLQDVEVLGTRDFVNNDDNVGPEQGDAPGQHSHGTLVLSTIVGVDTGNFLGVAPGAKVLLSKTEDISVEEPVEEDNFVAGIEWLEEEGADIFTASLGYFDWYTPSDLDGQTAVTTVASTIAVENGLIMFNSAGNSGPDPMTLGAPADAEGVITLGAAHFNGEIAGFSSRGPTADGRTKPEVVAPGVDVVCADPGTVDEYRTANGTSLSNPLAAGLGALLLEAYPEMTPADMLALLRETSDQADNPDNNRGWGMIDGYKAGLEYCSCNDVDNDGQADIIVASNAYNSSCPDDSSKQSGIRIFGSASGSWVRTRRIWNQHTYHVTNVEESGAIPAKEEANWKVPRLNNYRQNVQPMGEFSAPDLVAKVLVRCDDEYELIARVRNLGQAAVPAGVAIGFYAGDPEMKGESLGTEYTTKALYPAEAEDVVLVLPNPPASVKFGELDAFVVIDDDNVDQVWEECRVDNNKQSGSGKCAAAG